MTTNAVSRITLLGSFLLCSCATQSPPPAPQAPQAPQAGVATQAILPPKIVSIPSAEAVPAPATDPAVYSDQAAYAAAIRAKVRKKLVLPRNVPDSASATVEVALSETGTVAGLKTLKGSGFPAYDSAIRRAIHSAQPYPLLHLPGHQGPLTMRMRFQIKE
jgi:TonB family protein